MPTTLDYIGNLRGPAGPTGPTLVPLTTVVAGVPELVWDANDQLVLTEVTL